jgi:Flp pilus assembly protein CpaB
LGQERKMNTEAILDSIRKALWTLVTLLIVVALGMTAQLASNLYWWWTKDRTPPEQSFRVVVAARDLKVGTVLAREDVGMGFLKVPQLPDHYVCIHMAPILPGQTIHADVKRGEPLDLEQTDLWTKNKQPQPGVGR